MRTILDILVFFGNLFLRLFKGGGTRVTVEARSEGAIESDRKRLEKLRAEVKRRKGMLDEVTVKIARAKSLGLDSYANELDPVRRLRRKQYDDARDEYERAGGRWP